MSHFAMNQADIGLQGRCSLITDVGIRFQAGPKSVSFSTLQAMPATRRRPR